MTSVNVSNYEVCPAPKLNQIGNLIMGTSIGQRMVRKMHAATFNLMHQERREYLRAQRDEGIK